MYIIKRDKEKMPRGEYSDDNPHYRRSFGETYEKYGKLSPREMSPLRRLAIKKMRFQGKRPQLVAEAAALREMMTKEINR